MSLEPTHDASRVDQTRDGWDEWSSVLNLLSEIDGEANPHMVELLADTAEFLLATRRQLTNLGPALESIRHSLEAIV